MRPQTTRAVPAYRKIRQMLQRQIESGKLLPGDVVPSERELARQHGVSLMTARNGVRELELVGLVERRWGAGTFVAPRKTDLNRLSFSTPKADRVLSAYSRTLPAQVIEAEHELTVKLGLPAGSKVLRLESLRLAGQQPFALEIGYVDAGPFSALERQPLDIRSILPLLEREFGIQVAYADEEFDTTLTSRENAGSLGVEPQSPVLRLRQMLYGSSGKAMIYTLNFYRLEKYSLMYRRYMRYEEGWNKKGH